MHHRRAISGNLGWQILAIGALLTTGIAVGSVVQLFKIDVGQQSHIVNASARARVGTGEAAMTLGFVVSGHPQTIVARALGPSLGKYGVIRAVQNPVLRVIRDSDGVELAKNDNWKAPGNERLRDDLKGYAPPDDREAACVLRLEPGSYSILVDGTRGQHGIALAELYKIDE